MAFKRKWRPWERQRLSNYMKARHETARKVREINAKTTDKKGAKPTKTTLPGVVKAFAEMIRAGLSSLRPTVALPQAVAPVVDEHAKGPVIATPVYPSEDYIVRTSLSASPDGSENIRGLLDAFNRPHGGWKTKYH